MPGRTIQRLRVGLAALALLVLTGGSAAPSASALSTASPGAEECASDSGARVRSGSGAQEPKLYPDNQAKAYGVIKDQPRLTNGSVTISTIFHVITDHDAHRGRADPAPVLDHQPDEGAERLVLRPDRDAASDTPFRFDLPRPTSS